MGRLVHVDVDVSGRDKQAAAGVIVANPHVSRIKGLLHLCDQGDSLPAHAKVDPGVISPPPATVLLGRTQLRLYLGHSLQGWEELVKQLSFQPKFNRRFQEVLIINGLRRLIPGVWHYIHVRYDILP